MGGTFDEFEEPQVPEDTSTCSFGLNFSYGREDLTLNFADNTGDFGQTWFWDFGDGSTSTEQNPTHVFTSSSTVEVCLTADYTIEETSCTKTICKNINLTFNPNNCNSVQNGSSPYDASDPVFLQVIATDEYCCEGIWDDVCQNHYDTIEEGISNGNTGGQIVAFNFSLLLNDPQKTLVNKIFNVPHFRERYLNICCEILEHNFTAERLHPIIDDNTDLIRDAIYEDENYIFSTNYFEYDAQNELGNGGVIIPPLKHFVSTRPIGVRANLFSIEHDCNLQYSPIAWHDVVVNEFMASNTMDGGIADPSGAYADWIEIYNNTDEIVNLGEMYLTDDPQDLQKWRFDLGTFLEPDSYMIIWADNDLEEEGHHANFKLSKSGESIYLSHEDGTVIDSLSYGEQQTNVASARRPNGIGDFVMQNATFASDNDNEPVGIFDSTIETDVPIFPNPTSASFFVDLKTINDSEQVTIFIKNALGQLVHTTKNPKKDIIEIFTHDFGVGLFTVQLVFEDKWSIAKKVLVLE